MSSDRESVGDLIPKDMLQVFSEGWQHGRAKRGSRRAASFRRAFKWFKRQRRKTRRKAAETHGDLLATGSPVELPPLTVIIGPKEEIAGNITLQEFNENVFVEGNRPKYVLDLHTEAQQSLKLQQQEDDRNGTDYPDDQSMISTVTAHTEDSMAFSELKGFESESTAADSVSMRSSISSRSGLRRQASTFRPLKPDKATEKTKTRKKYVRTVAGIPRHVQKELGLDRAAWITTSPLDQLFNGDVITPSIITAVDGAPNSSTQETTYLQDKQNMQTIKQDNIDIPLLENFNNPILQRTLNPSADPGTLGVPENPGGSVMSISPQATYLSTIIPNAVLPPSVDVVELSRGQSRSSVRTVSKSSLVSASPASTRASSRVSSHRSTTPSDYSAWSHSGSSETLVSNSSTISSCSTPRVASRGSQIEITNKALQLTNHSPRVLVKANGGYINDGNRKTADAFMRNLSVKKPSKIAPVPPSRSFSLHRGYVDGSPYPVDISSLTTQKFNCKTSIPPSNGLTANHLKPIQSDKKTEHSYPNCTSKLSELKSTILSAKTLHLAKNSSPAVMAILSLLEIPAHPDVLAPSAPPPETWAHNQRTFELLCGPGPVNYARWAKKRGLKVADESDLILTNGDPPSDMQPSKLKANFELLTRVACDHRSPSPPPDHFPPAPNHPPPPDFVPSTPTPPTKVLKDPTSWIPPPPLFPPPAPPVVKTFVAPINVPNDIEFPPPPPPFSPQSLFKMPPLPLDIPPPPPPQVPPPPSNPPSDQPAPLVSIKKELVTSSVNSHQIIDPPPPVTNVLKSQHTIIPSPVLPLKVKSQQGTTPPPLHIDVKDSIPPPLSIPSPLPLSVVTKDIKSQPENVPQPPPLPTEVNLKDVIALLPPLTTEENSKDVIALLPPLTTEENSKEVIALPPPLPTEGNSKEVIPLPPPLPTEGNSKEVIPLPPPLPIEVKSKEVVAPSPPLPPPLPIDVKSQRVIIPPPPPLPTDIKSQVIAPLPEVKKEKSQTEKRSDSPSPAKEESSGPVITQSLLQMVRLRSVKASQSQDLDKPSQPPPKLVTNQEAPPKPIRRSLILTSLPPEVEALSSTETKMESLPIPGLVNALQVSGKPELQSNNINHTSPPMESQNPSTLNKPQIEQTFSNPDLNHKLQTLQEPDSASVLGSVMKPKTQFHAQDPNKTPQNSQSSTIGVPPSKMIGVPSKTPNVPSTCPEGSGPSNQSMRLQDAIRLKASVMSSKDIQVKPFGLRSPPASNSPASTASFIFSKSQKKVVIETPSSPEVQAGLRKTLAAEIASISETTIANDVNKIATKVPPAIAKKPNGKIESMVPSFPKTKTEQTETVQTAGQDVRTEN